MVTSKEGDWGVHRHSEGGQLCGDRWQPEFFGGDHFVVFMDIELQFNTPEMYNKYKKKKGK